ncbi:hypothetical protein PVAP13_1NG550601 [Panicum virgatum]|uniref:Remorin C-terminal domain-containing protein n=1 Tax=Panicum virgatum TaxID=38727 RepID=A0A8T0X905_PANVG|nr:hypothetical protein PVAP13_1NG550601 [Panicum virgatum]
MPLCLEQLYIVGCDVFCSQFPRRAQKKMSSIMSWENTKKAAAEAKLRTREEKLEKKKAEYAEKMRNQIAAIHKEAQERKFSSVRTLQPVTDPSVFSYSSVVLFCTF